MPPTGPSQKICVDLIFEGPISAFVATKHLTKPASANAPPLKAPKSSSTHVGVDVNRPGQYMLAYYPRATFSRLLLDLCQRYLDLKEVIRSYHRSISLVEKDNKDQRARKLRQELNLVYNRRSNILKEIHARSSMELGWQLKRTGATTLVIEGLDVDPKGTRGALAEAIYSMPDERIVFARAVLNVTATQPNQPASLKVVDPRGTSRIHVGCGGRLKRSKGHYDIAPCKKCGKNVNTHENAAQAIVYIAQGRSISPEL